MLDRFFLFFLFLFVFLAPIAVIGVPYRVYQIASGALRVRLEAGYGFRQMLRALGITLVLGNIPIVAYTLYVVYAWITRTLGTDAYGFHPVLATT